MRTAWLWLTRYMVAVQWEEKKVVHFAKTYREALEWAQCYSTDASVMIGKRGRLLAARAAV